MAAPPEVSSISNSTPLSDMEERMRTEIRTLQEQRAATMMAEVVDLQRERDLALGRIKALKKAADELQAENTFMKSVLQLPRQQQGLVHQVSLLKRSLLEEQLVTSDLKEKLATSVKQNAVLLQRLKRYSGSSSPGGVARVVAIGNQERERSKSMTEVRSDAVIGHEQSHDVSHDTASPLLKKQLLDVPTVVSPGATKGTSPQNFSPTVIARRYKLAASASRNAATQTDQSQPSTEERTDQSDLSPGLSSETSAKVEGTAEEVEEGRVKKERDRVKQLRQKCKVLEGECSVLEEGLAQFSLWTRHKLQQLEEDLDIFKVVYSLHGSLSKEGAVMEGMRVRLVRAEGEVVRLQAANRHLTQSAAQSTEQHTHCLREIDLLKEKVALLISSSPPSHPHKSHTHHTRHKGRTSSPLITSKQGAMATSPTTTSKQQAYTKPLHDVV